MGMYSIGGDTVAIVKRVPGGRDRLNRPILVDAPTPIEKQGCSFQVLPVSSAERREAMTASTNVVTEVARVILEVDDDTKAIDETDAVRKLNSPTPTRTYELAGPAVVETDIDGGDDHVHLVVEWQHA